MTQYFRKMKSPLGELTLVANEKSLLAVLWEDDSPDRVRFSQWVPAADSLSLVPLAILDATQKQLCEYFSGTRIKFNLPFEFNGTEFQKKVWNSLLTIPYGKTLSYSELSQRVGSPKAYRAVGAANGKNPISIIFPCHRVIGKSGKLTGFAGGLEAKNYLLKLEQAYDPNQRSRPATGVCS